MHSVGCVMLNITQMHSRTDLYNCPVLQQPTCVYVASCAAAAMLWAGMICSVMPMSLTLSCAHDAGGCNHPVGWHDMQCKAYVPKH